MSVVLMNDPATQRVAVYEEAPGGGDADDPNSLRNRPLNSPQDWIDLIRFHADFDYYQVHSEPTEVVVNHPQVNSQSTNVGGGGMGVTRVGRVESAHHTLTLHGLGYPPAYMVALNGALIGPGSLVQTLSGGRSRKVTPYATATEIKLLEVGASSSSHLTATAITYEVVVFKAPVAENDLLVDFDPVTGAIILGNGKFDSSRKMLRRAGTGDSPFDLALGRTVDIKNGGTRTVLPDGTTFSETNYNGSFTGSDSIQCAVD